MHLVLLCLRYIHLFGFASLGGGLLAQVSLEEKTVSRAVWHGALTQLVTGFLLVGLKEPHVNHAKIGVKLLLLLVILGILLIHRKKTIPRNSFLALLLLVLTELGVAVFWA